MRRRALVPAEWLCRGRVHAQTVMLCAMQAEEANSQL